MAILEPVVDYLSKKRDLTYWEYTLLPDDGNRYEILEGELQMTPSPKTKHKVVSRNLLVEISLFLKKNKIGKVFGAPYDVILSQDNVVEPDIIFISNDNLEIITEDNVQGSPDLLIEILSPSSQDNDRNKKKVIYETYGVKEYWIVDPDLEVVDVYILKDGKFSLNQHLEKQGELLSSVLKEFKMNIKMCFVV